VIAGSYVSLSVTRSSLDDNLSERFHPAFRQVPVRPEL
jgi:hypothetical protein